MLRVFNKQAAVAFPLENHAYTPDMLPHGAELAQQTQGPKFSPHGAREKKAIVTRTKESVQVLRDGCILIM